MHIYIYLTFRISDEDANIIEDRGEVREEQRSDNNDNSKYGKMINICLK